MVPPELHSDQSDNTDQLIANLAKKITLSDKEMNPTEDSPGFGLLTDISSTVQDNDKPADSEFIQLGSQASSESMLQSQLTANMKALLMSRVQA